MKKYRIRMITGRWHVFIYTVNPDGTLTILPDEGQGPFDGYHVAYNAAVATGYPDADR